MNPYDLHPERLATTDENGDRVYIHPEDIQGKWRTRRKIVYSLLIFVYLVIPWTKIGGKQTILLDLPDRHFILFGVDFWAHDTPYLFFLLAGFLFLMAFVTTVWGRAWCGWACPQTVFIDMLFRPIERLIEGRAKKRKELDEMPLNLEKVMKRILKWTLFIITSLLISHSFLGYFLGSYELLSIVTHSPLEHWQGFLVMIVATSITLFDFGWFREQFCIIMCPYGRFQSVLMDSDSLVVAYDEKRGEPRRNKDVSKEQQGDCINCYHCVRACPTGIDIRRGTQLECIACTMCIDACDDIMRKVHKPEGLIRYSTENKLEGKKSPIIHPRTVIYLVILLVLGVASTYFMGKRQNLSAYFIRGNREPFQKVIKQNAELEIVNHYRVEMTYQGERPLDLYFDVGEELLSEGLTLVTPQRPFPISRGRKKVAHIFFKFSQSLLKRGTRKIKVFFHNGKEATKDNIVLEKEVSLVGPIK